MLHFVYIKGGKATMKVKEYIENKKLKGGDWLTIIFNGQAGIKSVSNWLKETKLMSFKCKELSKQVIKIEL